MSVSRSAKTGTVPTTTTMRVLNVDVGVLVFLLVMRGKMNGGTQVERCEELEERIKRRTHVRIDSKRYTPQK